MGKGTKLMAKTNYFLILKSVILSILLFNFDAETTKTNLSINNLSKTNLKIKVGRKIIFLFCLENSIYLFYLINL